MSWLSCHSFVLLIGILYHEGPLITTVMSISQEEKEEMILAPYAIKSRDSAGRKYPEKFDDKRLCFQRDKDRIIHCKSFRRLDEKTQVFAAGSGDHFRTRLTHTLEVAQVSRDLARRLGLNEDLCEAIALAHDLGHPPFGHAGEKALDEVMKGFGLHFEHNEQSRRVVEVLEKVYPGFDGLNLTHEVLDGMIKHQTSFDQADKKFEVSAHLEAQIVNVADEIAYNNHDMDDGLRSGIIDMRELEKFEIWKRGEAEVEKKYGRGLEVGVLQARVISSIMSLMIEDLCKQTLLHIEAYGIKSAEDVRHCKEKIAVFSEEMRLMVRDLRGFLFDHFYMMPPVRARNVEGMGMIKKLFKFYLDNPNRLPREDKGPVSIKDYIAGMTDNFLIQEFSHI